MLCGIQVLLSSNGNPSKKMSIQQEKFPKSFSLMKLGTLYLESPEQHTDFYIKWVPKMSGKHPLNFLSAVQGNILILVRSHGKQPISADLNCFLFCLNVLPFQVWAVPLCMSKYQIFATSLFALRVFTCNLPHLLQVKTITSLWFLISFTPPSYFFFPGNSRNWLASCRCFE